MLKCSPVWNLGSGYWNWCNYVQRFDSHIIDSKLFVLVKNFGFAHDSADNSHTATWNVVLSKIYRNHAQCEVFIVYNNNIINYDYTTWSKLIWISFRFVYMIIYKPMLIDAVQQMLRTASQSERLWFDVLNSESCVVKSIRSRSDEIMFNTKPDLSLLDWTRNWINP